MDFGRSVRAEMSVTPAGAIARAESTANARSIDWTIGYLPVIFSSQSLVGSI